MGQNFSKSALITEGILLFILGVIAIWVPAATAISITLLVGILCIVAGVVQLLRVFQNREHASFWTLLISAVLAVLIGVLLLVFPLHGALALALLLGIWFLIHGVIQIGISIQMRHYSSNWGLMLISGIISVILAIIIWSGWPLGALWVVGLMLGINLIFFGASLFVLAFRSKRSV